MTLAEFVNEVFKRGGNLNSFIYINTEDGGDDEYNRELESDWFTVDDIVSDIIIYAYAEGGE